MTIFNRWKKWEEENNEAEAVENSIRISINGDICDDWEMDGLPIRSRYSWINISMAGLRDSWLDM